MRADLPSPPVFWAVQALVVIGEVSLLGGAVRRVDARASRPVADRRWWQLRGIRPRLFARSHTIAELLVDHPSAGRTLVGRYGTPGRLLAVQHNVQTLVVAAPRAGKTSG